MKNDVIARWKAWDRERHFHLRNVNGHFYWRTSRSYQALTEIVDLLHFHPLNQ